MAREDILTALQIALTQKEGPPPADDNTLIQKMIAPNETMTASDQGVTLTVSDPTEFVWGGNNTQGQYISPGWKWSQGEYYKSYRGVILRDSPVIYLPLNEKTGTVAHDLSGNGFNGTINNGVALGATGFLASGDTVMSFNGSASSHIDIPANMAFLTSGDMSIEAWAKFTGTLQSWEGIVTTKTGASDGVNLQFGTAQGISALVGDGTAYSYISPNAIIPQVDTWYHVGLSHKASTNVNTLYVNGSKVGTGTRGLSTAFTTLQVGSFYNTVADPLTGSIGQVAFYNYVLSDQQWLNHFNARKAVFN